MFFFVNGYFICPTYSISFTFYLKCKKRSNFFYTCSYGGLGCCMCATLCYVTVLSPSSVLVIGFSNGARNFLISSVSIGIMLIFFPYFIYITIPDKKKCRSKALTIPFIYNLLAGLWIPTKLKIVLVILRSDSHSKFEKI